MFPDRSRFVSCTSPFAASARMMFATAESSIWLLARLRLCRLEASSRMSASIVLSWTPGEMSSATRSCGQERRATTVCSESVTRCACAVLSSAHSSWHARAFGTPCLQLAGRQTLYVPVLLRSRAQAVLSIQLKMQWLQWLQWHLARPLVGIVVASTSVPSPQPMHTYAAWGPWQCHHSPLLQ